MPTTTSSVRLPLIITLVAACVAPGQATRGRTASAVRHGQAAPATDDPWRWLEDVEGARALQWVREQNDKTLARYTADPLYKTLYPEALAVLDSQSRVPDIAQRGDYVYNLWQDKTHPRGLYRRATAASFRHGTPQWQPVLDVDALSARENKPWAFGGITCLSPTYVHCLVSLAPGGGDAVERREFNADTLSFVDGGFFVPTAKSRVDWVDQDTLYVGTDFGAGTLTESGYPRAAKIWKRGTPLAGARTIFETAATSVGAGAHRIRTAGGDIDLVTEQLTTWRSHVFQIVGGDLETTGPSGDRAHRRRLRRQTGRVAEGGLGTRRHRHISRRIGDPRRPCCPARRRRRGDGTGGADEERGRQRRRADAAGHPRDDARQRARASLPNPARRVRRPSRAHPVSRQRRAARDEHERRNRRSLRRVRVVPHAPDSLLPAVGRYGSATGDGATAHVRRQPLRSAATVGRLRGSDPNPVFRRRGQRPDAGRQPSRVDVLVRRLRELAHPVVLRIVRGPARRLRQALAGARRSVRAAEHPRWRRVRRRRGTRRR